MSHGSGFRRRKPKAIAVHSAGEPAVVVELEGKAFADLRQYARKRGVPLPVIIRSCLVPQAGRNAAYGRRALFKLDEWELDGIGRLAANDGLRLEDVCRHGIRYYLVSRGLFPPPQFAAALKEIRLDPPGGEIDNGSTFVLTIPPPAPSVVKCAEPNEIRPKESLGGFLRRAAAWIFGRRVQGRN